ncbi:hypothetical protein IFM89_033399 [Coptis chinensis]|uniref:PI4-kinase N-terminal domain-containing protein n=1 Tax=Coptis chinensis TaxID=261450 RepID=A0A835LW53_9MAGN|nr:hypothetical protein IFM89_033399 [Coptis chinensis]
MAQGCRKCLMSVISDSFCKAGYNSAICKSKWRSFARYPSEEHTYIDVVDKNTKKGFRDEHEEILRNRENVDSPLTWNEYKSMAFTSHFCEVLEDELKLNALHNPGSRRGSGNEKAALVQRSALCAALGGQVEVGAMSTIAAFLEIICFSSNGGILNCDMELTASRSAFSHVFEYLKTPNLLPVVLQGLIAIIHRSFEVAMSWLGRVVLARHVLNNIPVHNMAIYRWPKSVLKECESIIRNFIWSGNPAERKTITVSWDKTCKPVEEGGLGIRRLQDINLAMLMKQVWCLLREGGGGHLL